MALLGQRGGGCIQLGELENVAYVLQQADFIAGKQRKQVFEAERKPPEDHFASIRGAKIAGNFRIQNKEAWGSQSSAKLNLLRRRPTLLLLTTTAILRYCRSPSSQE